MPICNVHVGTILLKRDTFDDSDMIQKAHHGEYQKDCKSVNKESAPATTNDQYNPCRHISRTQHLTCFNIPLHSCLSTINLITAQLAGPQTKVHISSRDSETFDMDRIVYHFSISCVVEKKSSCDVGLGEVRLDARSVDYSFRRNHEGQQRCCTGTDWKSREGKRQKRSSGLFTQCGTHQVLFCRVFFSIF